MNILVTGGAGYIGSHAVSHLLDCGHKIIVLDNLSRGHKEAVDARARLFVGNVADRILVLEILRSNGIEAVMHFAADIEVAESVTDPMKYYGNNFASPLHLLESMIEAGVKKFVFSSTAAVYGNPIAVPIEETHPRNPLNPYGRSKLMMEMALEDFATAYGIGYAILRYFNVAGAHPDAVIGEDHRPESHLIPRILMAALNRDMTLPIYGVDYPTHDGTCIRDYIHVQDLVNAHLLALLKLKESVGNVYNLGSETGFSVLEVVAACRKVTGRQIDVKPHARRPGDGAVLIASSEKIRRELGWTRRFPQLETIVAHAWKWHSTHPAGYGSVKVT